MPVKSWEVTVSHLEILQCDKIEAKAIEEFNNGGDIAEKYRGVFMINSTVYDEKFLLVYFVPRQIMLHFVFYIMSNNNKNRSINVTSWIAQNINSTILRRSLLA